MFTSSNCCWAQELTEKVVRSQRSSVLHTSTDCVMRKDDFEQLCEVAVFPGSSDVLKLQLLDDKRIAVSVSEEGDEVSTTSTHYYTV